MDIQIRGAREHNLKDVDVRFGGGLTVVTGISGSGKTSLVFDTLYHEARRRFLEVFNAGRSVARLAPADVDSITGIGPTVAVEQNLLNRNPLSTLASASGLHPFLRLLFARFGTRHCPTCHEGLAVMSEDEVVKRIQKDARKHPVVVEAVLARGIRGSHQTLLKLLSQQFTPQALVIDGKKWNRKKLLGGTEHDIAVVVGDFSGKAKVAEVRETVAKARALGASSITVRGNDTTARLSMANVCGVCGTWFGDLEPKHFRIKCGECEGDGCDVCNNTGLHPLAAGAHWAGRTFPELLELSVTEALSAFEAEDLPSTAARLEREIVTRLHALETVGLGYVQLNRPSPSLSRGESQRVRLAISLTSRLEDIVHVLDEPTIGQHPVDVARLLPAFRKLLGPVIYVEHDRLAAAEADSAVDLGPRAGAAGGEITFTGTPSELWKSSTTTGTHFSLKHRVHIPELRPEPTSFLTVLGAHQHNLRDIDVPIALGRLNVITGLSGSGKSTLIEHVLVPSLEKKTGVGCKGVEGPDVKAILVDQRPIGKNPRSNPATYTKLSEIVRDLFSSETGLSRSHFSFNRPEGHCKSCKGMGATEVKMRYLPSIWIQCSDCEGKRFRGEVLAAHVRFGDKKLSIDEFYDLSIEEVRDLLTVEERLPESKCKSANRILDALVTIGLGYIKLGQPSPTLSGGEAQRVKLAKYLGKAALSGSMLILDEPSTGLHPEDLTGLLKVFDRLVRSGATIVIVEHNTDVIRAADWVIDLGPSGGPNGGELVFAGDLEGLIKSKRSQTAKALRHESKVKPRDQDSKESASTSEFISVRGATANNLRNVDVRIPKGKLSVVTGPSGSGKSSLVRDVLQAEADRRYYETLSVYERQGTREGPEAPVESVSGLGVSLVISSRRRRGAGYWDVYALRSKVGTVTEISNHLSALLATIGDRSCPKCGEIMNRKEYWECPECGTKRTMFKPRDFSSRTYSSACEICSGISHTQIPVPEKLLVNPDKPICDGAMYSPGYFPKGYFCTETSWAYGALRALGARYGFDPAVTPWNEMSEKAQETFLYGDSSSDPLEITYLGTRRGKRVEVKSKGKWAGFYRWVSDWDIGGTYTRREPCEACKGTGLRPEFLTVRLAGHNIHEMKEMPLSELKEVIEGLSTVGAPECTAWDSTKRVRSRLDFLEKVGLGYLHLNRVASTLSAGEAQRIILASLLGSGLTSLTILLDEPTRGMHPSEVDALIDSLHDLRDEGNTVIVVEHDSSVIRAADEIIDMGPSSGKSGGSIVAQGTPSNIQMSDTLTAEWLKGERHIDLKGPRRTPLSWMTVKGAREHNLQNLTVEIPLGVLTGICGVSGSGKSTLMIDTLGRELAPKKFSTSVSYEILEPGEHDKVEGRPHRTVLLDQGRKGIRSPGQALGLFKPLLSIFSESEDAYALGVDLKTLAEPCSVCEGRGRIRTDMGFLPDVFSSCEICNGTGRSPEAWDIRVKGISLPELNYLTLGEINELFGYDEEISKKIQAAIDVGLDYLVLHQPSVTLSGGEIQRLKIAQELSKTNKIGTLFILDEPTVGQHMEDVGRLIGVLDHLVSEGNSVVVVEHHPHILAACDWLIELGPVGGPNGGRVIATGTPETVSKMNTPTSPYLTQVLEGEM
ncbi:MAG: ATP-binding cassette domain-containing protein [Candidatus Thorarchaeota archaeon]|nr:MAG: ATP-binding cassette domain-containing protein [Candidatus Thorarchaeota archaeon]